MRRSEHQKFQIGEQKNGAPAEGTGHFSVRSGLESSSAGNLQQALSTAFLFLFFVAAVTFLSAILAPQAKSQTAALANDPATLAASALESNSGRPFVYSGQIVFETLRSADEASPVSYQGWYMATGSATHKKSTITGTARVSYSREYSYDQDDGTKGSFDNPRLSISKSFISGRDFEASWIDSVSVSTSASIGADNLLSKRRHFLWSNGLAVTGSKSLGRFFLQQSFGYTHSFYEYDMSGAGEVNAPNAVRSASAVYYSLSDHFSLGASLVYGYAVSFQDVGRGSQIASLSADYSVSDKVALSVGVSTERGTLEPDGQADRIRFYAPETAQYFFDVIFIL